VTAKLSYRGRGPQGDINETKTLVFRKDTPPGRFSTYLAAPEQRSYDYEYEVRYKGGNQTYKVSGKADGDVLVLDTDRLGVLRVEVQMGLIDWDKIRQVFLKMWYGSGSERKETEFTWTPRSRAAPGRGDREGVDQPHGYQAVFVDREQPAHRAGPADFPLEATGAQPADRGGAGGRWSHRPAPSASCSPRWWWRCATWTSPDYTVDDAFTFTKSESKIWKVPLRNKHLRKYEYRVTVFYVDGVTREDGWRATDKTIPSPWVTRSATASRCRPTSSETPYLFGTVHLQFDDAQEGIHAEKTLEVTDFTKPLFWRFRTGAPDRHTYKYQLTLFKEDGEVSCRRRRSRKRCWSLVPPPA
jgi:hypothetical protein